MPEGSSTEHLSGVIPPGWSSAINDIRQEEWDGSGDPPSRSTLVRDMVELYFAVQLETGDLPAGALDDVQGIESSEVLEQYGLATAGDCSVTVGRASEVDA